MPTGPASSVAQGGAEQCTGWRFERPWLLVRDICTAAYLVLLLHELLIRVILVVALPLLAGFSLPPLPYQDVFLFTLLGIGVWRMVADPAWRGRLSVPGLWTIAGLTLLLSAFMWLNLNRLIDLAIIKGVILPMLLYAVGIFCGLSRRVFLWTMGVMAAVNALVSIVIALFFSQQYVALIYIIDALMPSQQGLFGEVFRHAAINIPTGLALARLAYMTLFTVTGLICLHGYAISPQRRLKLWYFIGMLLSTAAVLSTFSRSGVATYAAAVMFYLIAASLSERRSASTQTSGVRLLAVTFAMCMIGFLLITGAIARLKPGADFLAAESLTSDSGGRLGMWAGVINEIERKHGWFFGLKSDFDVHSSIAIADAREKVWSEFAYGTVDNQYLNIMLKGGLFAVACYFLACVLMSVQFFRNRDWLTFGFMVFTLLIDLNLRSGSYGQDIFCLYGAALLADAAARQGLPRLSRSELGRGPLLAPSGQSRGLAAPGAE